MIGTDACRDLDECSRWCFSPDWLRWSRGAAVPHRVALAGAPIDVSSQSLFPGHPARRARPRNIKRRGQLSGCTIQTKLRPSDSFRRSGRFGHICSRTPGTCRLCQPRQGGGRTSRRFKILQMKSGAAPHGYAWPVQIGQRRIRSRRQATSRLWPLLWSIGAPRGRSVSVDGKMLPRGRTGRAEQTLPGSDQNSPTTFPSLRSLRFRQVARLMLSLTPRTEPSISRTFTSPT